MFFFMSQVWTMKVTESTNICYVSDTVACTIKMNVKETFIGMVVFANGFVVNGLQSENKRPIT